MAINDSRYTAEQVKILAQVVMPRSTFTMLSNLYTITLILLGWWVLPLEVFIRKEFGDRYLSLQRIWISWTLFRTFTFLYALLSVVSGANPLAFLMYYRGLNSIVIVKGIYYLAFYYGFLLCCLWHRYRISQRARRGIAWLSTSFGISHLAAIPWQRLVNIIPYANRFITVDDYFLYRFIEPILFFYVGRFVYRLDTLLGSYIVIASAALFIKNNMAYGAFKSAMQDLADAHLVSRYLGAALEGKPKELTAGFSVVPVPVQGLFTDEPLDVSATVRESMGMDAQTVS